MSSRKNPKKLNFLHGHERLEELVEHLHLHHKKKKKNWLGLIWRILAWFFISVFLLGLILAGFLFFRYRNFYDLALSGKSGLESSLLSAKEQNFEEMLSNSQTAAGSFSELLSEIQKLRHNFILKRIKLADGELADLENLLNSLELVSKSMEKVAVIGQELKGVMSGRSGSNFAEFSRDEKRRLLKMIYESGPELNGVKADLELSLLDLERIQGKGVLLPLKGRIAQAKTQLGDSLFFLSKMTLASELLPEFAGYPEKSDFLVLFQNSDELRPTGGFLGTYGILSTDSGDIIRFDTHDIYHMDMPMEAIKKFSVVPPDPIKLYLNNKWFMRDANWSPDWPTASEQILWFYKQEDALLPPKNQINNFKGEFSGVVGITPDFVKTLLSIIGPVTVNGATYTADNFSHLLEYKVEQDYVNQDISSWERKEVIGSILEEIKVKAFNLPYYAWADAFKKIDQGVAAKNVQVYLKNKYLNGLVKEMNMGGEIKNTDNDYLMIVDANLGARKTDSVMTKSAVYEVQQRVDGLYAKVTINYAHGGKIDWRTDNYKTYTRIYVPKDSRLLKISGLTKGKAEVGEEAGKEYFGGFFSVNAGGAGVLTFEYKLPTTLEDKVKNGKYQLYIQKQAGNRLNKIKVDLKTINAIKSYEPVSTELKGQNNLIWSSALPSDKEFIASF